MAVLFVIYIPSEEEDTNLGTSESRIGESSIAVTFDNDIEEPVVDDDTCAAKPLLNVSGSIKHVNKVSLEDSRRMSETNLKNLTLSNQLKPATSNASNVQGSQLLEIKKDGKLRFQVVPIAKEVVSNDETNAVDAAVKNDETAVNDIVIERMTLKEAVCDILLELQISNEVWEKTASKDQWRLEFIVDSNQSEQVLHRLIKFGIGRIPETSVSSFPSNVHYEKRDDNPVAESERRAFVRSIKSRLTVTQVVIAVTSNASLTFDFLILILLASMIAGLGLAESSSVVLVASMLISPLMGPIVGFTFGTVIRNSLLWKMSFRNEIIGLSVCLSFGFLFGLLTGAINNTGANWGSSDSWPTAEMQARGMLRSLWVGVCIALPSGAGVALSILGGNTGSLVGVAISASLLPPAVNAGMLWGLSLVTAISRPSYELVSDSDVSACKLVNNNYNFIYSCDMPTETAILGSVSLLLTILNIICIFVAGICVLKLKEVAPHTALSEDSEAFWKRDIPVMRHTYRTIKGAASMDLAKQAKLVLADIQNGRKDPENVATFLDNVKNDPEYIDITGRLQIHGMNLLNQVSKESTVDHSYLDAVRDMELLNNRYHTITNASKAKELLSSIKVPTVSPSGGGSVVRMHRPMSMMATPEDDVRIIDCEKLSNRQKCRQNLLRQRYLSVDAAPSKIAWIDDEV